MWQTWSLICTKQRPLKERVWEWFQVNKKNKKYFFALWALNYWPWRHNCCVDTESITGSVNGQCICGIWGGLTEGWSLLNLLWMLGDCKGNAPHNMAWSYPFCTYSLSHEWGQTSVTFPTGHSLWADALTPLLNSVPLQLIWKLEVHCLDLKSSVKSKRVCTLVALGWHAPQRSSGFN